MMHNDGRQGLGERSTISDLKRHIHQRLLDTMDFTVARNLPHEQLYSECMRQVQGLLDSVDRPFSQNEKEQMVREVLEEIFGLGPLEPLFRDKEVNDILVNGAEEIYVERNGVLEKTNARFRDNEQLLQVIQRIAGRVGRRIDESSPMLDARLADGSRVNAIIPPLALDGPSVSIRQFGSAPLTVQNLLEYEALTKDMAQFLEACVHCKLNILLSGGTGSGKTTALNILSQWIPNEERVVTIEDSAELQLQRDHVVRLETRPPNIEGKGEVTQRDLLRNSLRMRPDRIVIGEVRGAEVLDMLQAMNTGHEGSMTTIHANTARDAVNRIENMVSMAGLNFPIHAIRQQIVSAIDILVQVERVTGGRRKMVTIAEITGMEGETILMQDIFRFQQTGVGRDGHATGHFEVCGIRPTIADRFEWEGKPLPRDFFQPRTLPLRAEQ